MYCFGDARSCIWNITDSSIHCENPECFFGGKTVDMFTGI